MEEIKSLDVKAMCEMLASASRPQERAGDVRDENGILLCGVCGKPREREMTVKNGDEELTVVVGTECDCMREERERRKREEAERKDREAIIKLRRLSMMDKRLSEATFDNTTITKENERVVGMAMRYVDKFDRMMEVNQGLLLWGKPGTGKSHLAACIANALLDKGVPVVMTSCIRLMDEMFNSDEAEGSILSRINTAKLLILDDLGAERGTEYAMEKVYDIIDARYRACKPMVITTNLTLDQLKTEPDSAKGRVYSRVLEICHPIRVECEEWRLKIARDRYQETKRILEGA